ncbi:TPA: MAP domain-containing protein [Staphylococcus aureus]|nr:MAP domain-containing protein [Staphylococcus aureus]
MKLKSFITVTLALGMIATTGATVASNEVSAAEKDKLPATQKAKEMQNVPYTIAVDGIMAFNQSYLNLPKDSQLSYLDLGNKVKALLYDERGVTPEKIRNAKSAVYTITWKDGSKKEMDLKKDSYTANLFDSNSIKQIDVNVKTK